MGDTVIHAKFNHFRVDEHELDFIGTCFIQKADQHGVDTNRFTGSCGTCDQQMRHLTQISKGNVACNVFTEYNRQFAFCALKLC